MPAPTARRLERIIGQVNTPDALGQEAVPGLYEAELRYLLDAEWAQTTDDILWRRSKLRLRLSPADEARLAAWLDAELAKQRQAVPLPT